MVQGAANTNIGEAGWAYTVPDKAFDFLAAGETLTLTYVAEVDSNYAPNNLKTLVPFTITVTGTNDVPVITTDKMVQTITFSGGTSTSGGPLISGDATSGKFAFTDADLTDTHTVTAALTGWTMSDGSEVPPGPLDAFKAALTASIVEPQDDSTGTGTGTISWQFADLAAYDADFIPVGQTLTLTYTVTLTDSQGATDTKTVEVTITGTDHAAEVWIHTMGDGSPNGLWSTAQNWETRLVPKATDDVIIITDQLHGLTPLFPVTIDASTQAVANSVTMNDFDLANPLHKQPELDNLHALTIGGVLSLSADSMLNNSGIISVGGKAEFLDQSVLLNCGTLKFAQGGDFKDQSSITNASTGIIDVTGGTLNVLVDVANSGKVTVESGATLALIDGTVDGGTVTVNGTLDLEGTSFLKNGALKNYGQVNISSTGNALDGEIVSNAGNIDVSGALLLDQGTTITNKGGGSITVESDGTLTLDGAAITDGATIDGGTITSAGALELSGDGVLENGTLVNSGRIKVSGSGNALHNENFTANLALEVLAGGALLLDLDTRISNGGGTITVDSTATLTLDNAIISGGTINDYSLGTDGTTVLPGAIDVAGSSTINGNASLNNGGVTVESNKTLTLDNVTATATAFTDTATGAALSVDSLDTLTLQGGASVTGGSLFNAGTVQIETTTGATFDGVDVVNTGGVIQVDTSGGPPVTLTFQDNSTVTDGMLSIGNNGKVEVASAATLTLDSVTVDNGTGSNPAGQIQVDGTLDVSGSTTISGGTLAISGTLESTGTNAIDGVALTNAGTFEVTAGTMTIDAASSVTTTGTFEVNGGSLIVEGALSGTATIVGASLLELGAANSGANVTFAAEATGTLQLDHAKTFDGTISGLDDNTLDLRDISYLSSPTVSYTGTASAGTLSIFVGGIDVSDIKLTGDYLGVHWALTDDGASHGTDVTEIPGAITSGLDSSGNASEGSAVTAIVTDGGQSVTGVTYHWQILDADKGWIDGTGTGVTSAIYTPGEQDEGHALRVSLTFTDANGQSESSTVSAGTVNPVADQPVVTASAATINEDGTSALTITLTNATDLFENSDDSVTVTVSLSDGATLHGTDVTDNDNGTFTLTAHSAADLSDLTITPASEFEGTVTVGVSAVADDGTAASAEGITSTTLTVSPVAEAPSAAAPATLTPNENATNVAITGVCVGPLAEDSDDSVSAALTVGHGTLHVDNTSPPAGVTVTGDDSGALTISGDAAVVNALLAGLTYTPTGEYEGADTLNLSVTSTDGANTFATPATASTTITVNPVAEAPSAAAPETLALNENATNVAITGVCVGPLAEDSDDSVSAALTVGHGTLHVDNTSLPAGVTVTGDDSGALTISGDAAAVNKLLAGLTYTPTGEYEGSDTLNLSVTSTDGANTFATPATVSTSITVNPVAEPPSAAAPATLTLNENATNVAITGVTVGPLAEDSDDSVSAALTVGHGTLHVDNTSLPAGVTVTGDDSGALTISGDAAAVNTLLAGLTYTPTGEYEGTDTLHLSVTSTDGANTFATPATASTIITVNPVADPATAAAPAALTLTENATNVAITGVTVGPLAEDSDDTVSAVLTVGHGTLHVGSLDGVMVTNNGTASLTVAGSAALVNTLLAGLTYTPATEFNGSDSLHVTVTSKDGSNTSPTKGTASTAITVNDGPNDLVATLDHSTAQQGVTMHVTGVKDGGITVSDGVSYKWQDSSNNGSTWQTVGTGSSFTPGESDEGKLMQLVVTYVDAGGSESSIYNLGMPNDLTATLDSTTAQQGVAIHVTSVDDGGTTESRGLSYAWQVSSDSGHTWATVGTNAAYTPVLVDDGKLLQVIVTYLDSGENESTTDSLGIVAPAKVWGGGPHDWQTGPWTPSGAPTSSDDAVVGASGTYTVNISQNAVAHSLIVTDSGATVEVVEGHTLTLGGSLTIQAGKFQIDAGGTLKDIASSGTITGAFTDNGTVEAGGGTLEIASTAISGSGKFKIDAGATLQLDHADSLNVAFTTSGTLVLKDPAHFTGTISDSGGSLTTADVIDLAGFDTSASVTYSGDSSGGTVTVKEAGHQVVLKVGANSTHWGAPVTDNHGGILIHDPPDDAGAPTADGGSAPASGDQAVIGVVAIDPGPTPSTIVANAPNQALTGSGVSDTFVFNFIGVGHDTVTNFHPDTDALQFSGTIFANAQAALNATQDDGHGNTVVTLDAHDTITLTAVLKAQLHTADIHFV